jgi:hypothetical protein
VDTLVPLDTERLRLLFPDGVPDELGDLGADLSGEALDQIGEVFAASLVLDGPSYRRDLLEASASVVARSVLRNDLPVMTATIERLSGAGLPRDEVWSQLALALKPQVAALAEGGEFDRDATEQMLRELPIASIAEVERAWLSAVSEGWRSLDEVDAALDDEFGDGGDLLEQRRELTFERLLEQDQLLLLAGDAGDLLCNPKRLSTGIVLTTRLHATGGVLPVGVDLAALRFVPGELATVDGQPIERDEQAREWRGPRGWLEPFATGALVAVSVEDGVVRVGQVAEPEGAQELARELRTVYDRQVAEPWVPIPLTDLVIGLLVEDPAAFSGPRPPLLELAAAAGLEVRGDEVAHELSVWQTDALTRRLRLAEVALDTDRDVAEELFTCAEAILHGEVVPVERLRSLLDDLDDPDLLPLLTEILLLEDDPDAPAVTALVADRLLRAASRPVQRATAGYVAARAAERDGRPDRAESLLREAVVADPGFVPAADRLAWTLSDRGLAEEARTIWHRVGVTSGPDLDALVVLSPPPEAAKLRRNDPCWCGSGRKYKVCHLRSTELPPLADRIDWLMHKRSAYLSRRGGEVFDDMTEAGDAMSGGDQARYEEAIFTPLLLDVLLHEYGWEQEFLRDRGPLLPADERPLVEQWVDAPRQLVEVRAVGPSSVTVVGPDREVVEVAVPEGPAYPVRRAVCGRKVADGEGHRFLPGAFVVPPALRQPVAEVLSAEPSGDRATALLTLVGRLVLQS